MDMNPVGWFEIYVQDMQRAKAFYEAVLGYELQPLPMPQDDEHVNMQMWAFPGKPEHAGATGALVHAPGCPSGGSGTMIYFACTDCAHEAQRVVLHGGSLHRDKTSIGAYGFIAVATDTEGNMFGLHSMQ